MKKHQKNVNRREKIMTKQIKNEKQKFKIKILQKFKETATSLTLIQASKLLKFLKLRKSTT